MTTHTTGTSRTQRDAFVQQVVVHHHAGDHYPDPWIVGNELRFTPIQVEAVLCGLRSSGWIAASPYGSERVRLTPRCWEALRQAAGEGSARTQRAA